MLDTGIDGEPSGHRAELQRDAEPQLHGRRPVDRRAPATPIRTSRARTRSNVDEDGHGTHVASTIGSPLNGIGIAGVAPKVELVNLRAGQDSGYFFLGPSLDALTYAGDHGIDVVNMSYYIDPWLYNCTANPADSPAEQREQRLVIAGHAARHRLRARPRRDHDRRRGQRPHGPRQAGVRRHARRTTRWTRRRPVRGSRPHDRQLVQVDADRGRRRDRRHLGRDRRSARPTTRTTASSRPTSPPPAATAATRRTARAGSRTRSSPPTRTGSASRRGDRSTR